MARTSNFARLFPLFHLCHVILVALSFLAVALHFTCPLCQHSQCSLSSVSRHSHPSPPSSVCQCLDGLYSSVLGSLSSLRRSLYVSPRSAHFFSYRSSDFFLIHLLLLLCGDVEINPGPTDLSTSISFACLNVRSASSVTDILHKPCVIQEFITDHSLEICSLTETWLTSDTPASTINSLTPDNFSFIHSPRCVGRGGGIAVVFCSFFKATVMPLPICISFEALAIRFSFSSHSFILLTVYRPPSSSLTTFLLELSTVLTDLVSTPSELFISGDFNLHMDDCHSSGFTSFTTLLNSFGLSQHVNFPTHTSGHTLDLIISRATSQSISDITGTFPAVSDHHAVCAKFLFPLKPRPRRITKSVRLLSKINFAQLNADILSSELHTSPATELNTYLTTFKSIISNLLDKHAPLKTISYKSTPDKPFITAEIKVQKAKRSRLETIYRKTRTQTNHEKFKEQSRLVTKLITVARRDYYRTLISKQSSQPRKLWNILNTLLSRSSPPTLPTSSGSSLASSFLTFFGEKIVKLHSALPVIGISPHVAPPVRPPQLSHFSLATIEEVKAAILSSSDATCCLDVIPTSVLKACVDSLALPNHYLINLCLQNQHFHPALKLLLSTHCSKKLLYQKMTWLATDLSPT